MGEQPRTEKLSDVWQGALPPQEVMWWQEERGLNWAWRSHNIGAQKGGKGSFKYWENFQHIKSLTTLMQDPAYPLFVPWASRACLFPTSHFHHLGVISTFSPIVINQHSSCLVISLFPSKTVVYDELRKHILVLMFLFRFPLHLSSPSRLATRRTHWLPASAWLTKPWSQAPAFLFLQWRTACVQSSEPQDIGAARRKL